MLARINATPAQRTYPLRIQRGHAAKPVATGAAPFDSHRLEKRLVEKGHDFDAELLQERIAIETRRVRSDVAVRAGQ